MQYVATGQIFHSGIAKGSFRKEFYCYYTNISNLAVLVYFVLYALLPKDSILYGVIHSSEFMYCITMMILLTFAIYHFVLRPALLSGKVQNGRERHYAFHNIIVHYIVPILTFVIWLVLGTKNSFSAVYCVTMGNNSACLRCLYIYKSAFLR